MPHFLDIITETVFILLQFFLFLFNYMLWRKNLFQPAVLFSFVWFAMLVLHIICRVTVLDELYRLSIDVLLIFFAGTLSFTAGGCFMYLYLGAKHPSNEKPAALMPEINRLLVAALVAVIALGLPFYIMASYKIFIASQAEEFFKGLRTELTAGNADVGPTKYFMSLSFVVYAVALYAYYKKKSRFNLTLLITSFLITATYAIFATGRTYFLIILSIYLGVSLLANPSFSLKKYFAALGIFLLTFVLIGVMYGKGGSVYYSAKQNVTEATRNLGIYLVTPMNALDVEIHKNAPTTNGDLTLRFFSKIAMSIGLIPQQKVPELIQQYAYVPYATNVYTYYSPYIRDYGVWYACFILFSSGIFHTWIYNKAVATRSVRYIFYYSFLLFPLLLSFFSDEYLTLFSLWLQIIFYTELIIFCNDLYALRVAGKV